MNQKGQRNYAVDFLKGFMIICIVLFHTPSYPFYEGFRGYLGVDVFFVLSGYFLMSGFLRKPMTTLDYTWKRIKMMLAPYLISVFVSCLLHFRQYLAIDSLSALVEQVGNLFFAAPFADELGGNLTMTSIVVGGWFLSALVICSFVLYGMLQYDKRLTILILLPAIILLGYNLMVSHSASFNSIGQREGFLGLSVVRGLFEMAMGMLLCHIYVNHKSGFEKRSVLINIVGVIAFFVFVAMMFTEETLDKYLIVTIPWFVLASVIEGSWLNALLGKIKGGLFARVGRYTLYVLCAHYNAQLVLNAINSAVLKGSISSNAGMIVCYLIATAIASAILYFLCRAIQNIRPRKSATQVG